MSFSRRSCSFPYLLVLGDVEPKLTYSLLCPWMLRAAIQNSSSKIVRFDSQICTNFIVVPLPPPLSTSSPTLAGERWTHIKRHKRANRKEGNPTWNCTRFNIISQQLLYLFVLRFRALPVVVASQPTLTKTHRPKHGIKPVAERTNVYVLRSQQDDKP